MIFDIDSDDGATVVGWVVPDHPSAVPVLDVVLGGRTRARIRADDVRPELVRAGLHATGRCGFAVSTAGLVDPDGAAAVELHELRSGTLVYRRQRPGMISLRLFHLEARTDPDPPLAAELRHLVQMPYSGLEHVGEETLLSILAIGFTGSVLAAGAVAPRRVERHLRENGFVRSVTLPEPHAELGARLLRLQRLGREGGGEGWRAMGAGGLPARLAPLDLADPAILRRLLRTLAPEEARLLADPATRLLAGVGREDVPGSGALPEALDALAGFDLVGRAEAPDAFRAGLSVLYGAPPLRVPPAAGGRAARDRAAVALAVRSCGAADDFLALDLDLYAAAGEAAAGA